MLDRKKQPVREKTSPFTFSFEGDVLKQGKKNREKKIN